MRNEIRLKIAEERFFVGRPSQNDGVVIEKEEVLKRTILKGLK